MTFHSSPSLGAYYFFEIYRYPSHQSSLSVNYPAGLYSYLKFSKQGAILSGQANHPSIVNTDLDEEAFAVRLNLGAFHTLTCIPANEITNHVVDLEEILGSSTNGLLDQLSQTSLRNKKKQLVEQYFKDWTLKNDAQDFSIELAALEALTEPKNSITSIAKQLGYSNRQLQRKLNTFIGFSPRSFRRIWRFEKTLQTIHLVLKSPKEFSWSTLALRCGYSDQAHFVRDFKEFTGFTPSAYMHSLHHMSDSFNTN